MTDASAPTLWCAICERAVLPAVLGDALPDTRVFLCARCAANPVLVGAFREGRARLAGEVADAGKVVR